MSFVPSRRLLTLFAAAALGAGLLAPAAVAAPAVSNSHAAPPVHTGSGYLALGDSVPFGYRESNNLPTPDYSRPDTFVGYPEDVAADLGLHLANASCPGETSASLIDVTAPSNGCETPGYRTFFPLHVAYSGSQLSYAVDYLKAHRDTRLVSLMIGANDGFLCQKTTADHCASELPAVLQRIAADVTTILDAIRHDAHYPGQVVIVNYYSTDYTSPLQNGQSLALNHALDTAAAPYDVRIADGFGAMQAAAAPAGGNTCAAGLLTVLTSGGCGVHPSAAGQAVLAAAVERVVRTAGR